MINYLKSLFKKPTEQVKARPLRSDLYLKDFEFDQMLKLKGKAKIAIVDDEEIPHIKKLNDDGYTIQEFSDIQNIDEFISWKYNIVVLDIQGIGKELSSNSGGWKILNYIKSVSPHTVVIMFTGADWSIKDHKSDLQLADDFLSKDLEFLDFKMKLDEAIKKCFSYHYHFEIEKKRIEKIIKNTNEIREIEGIVFKYGKDKTETLSQLRNNKTNIDAIGIVDNFLSIASNITQLISDGSN